MRKFCKWVCKCSFSYKLTQTFSCDFLGICSLVSSYNIVSGIGGNLHEAVIDHAKGGVVHY